LADTKIKEKILRDAKSDGERTLQEAKNRATEILKDAKQRASEIEKQTEEIATREKKKELERRLSEARMENRKTLLKERRRIIDSVFEEAKERLLSLKKPDYIKFIAKMIKGEITKEPFTFILSEKDVKRFGKGIFTEILKKVGGSDNASFETGTFEGGCILRKKSYEFNATIDTVLERVKEKLESELSKVLFS
jgi:V/A-type H+-transporting ATPase subunit E